MEREKKIHYTVCVFVIIAVFCYVFSGILGVNVPRYYPVTGEWLTYKEKDVPSMGYYGKIAFTFPIALILTAVFYITIDKFECALTGNEECLRGGAILSLLFGIFYYVGEEWHSWGIDKRGLATKDFFNAELSAYLIVVLLFIAFLITLGMVSSRVKKAETEG